MEKKLVEYTVVDAFTETAFKGNPAAVCLLKEDKGEEWLRAVAAEFNLAETCYLTRLADSDLESRTSSPRFRLRWFTPVDEVTLCGHATLAAAHTLFSSGVVDSDTIEFSTLSGILTAKRVPEVKSSGDNDIADIQNGEVRRFSIELDFPVVPILEHNSEHVSSLSKVFDSAAIVEIKKTGKDDLLVVLPSGKAVEEFQPQVDAIRGCPGRGIIITGRPDPNSGFDFFSRFFCPKLGVNEDPVCGSAHCVLTPYWSKKLGKNDLVAYAASPRGGIVKVGMDEVNQRVKLCGKAVTVMRGTILS